MQCRFDTDGIIDAEFIPVNIDPKEYRPKLASNESARDISQSLQKLSRELGTELNIIDKNSSSPQKIRLYKRLISK